MVPFSQSKLNLCMMSFPYKDNIFIQLLGLFPHKCPRMAREVCLGKPTQQSYSLPHLRSPEISFY